MATTTATLNLTSADLTGDSLALTATTQLKKAGSTVGLDQTTGVSRKYYPTAVSNQTLIDAGDYSDTTKAHKIYVRNLSTDATEYLMLSVGGSNTAIGRLYAQDWTFFPYDGTLDIDVTTSAATMTVEYMVVHEA
tara:strand:+ start:691 stop:1095 length:405 start_codon:yes stop_codon:yes gene_type:complete